ncbi:P-loop NTPase fold protein [Fibrobacter sp.]|uniref:P-loop NTPase fold protein n=1 Tax=Fibrobacter sp. TaxID=35828 RepID=UPI0025BFFBC9|nr:P-loop NTPase fold protein [Fibrobacter sp.]MBR3073869.1 hypothetical protein [Fibrobacter sp.]
MVDENKGRNMSNSNKHIEEFLDYYLNKEQSPDYAVLITGCWGSGKTYFVKNYLAKGISEEKDFFNNFDWFSEPEKYSVIYISLFGVQNQKEIEGKIQNICFPFLEQQFKDFDYLPSARSLVGDLVESTKKKSFSSAKEKNAKNSFEFFKDEFLQGIESRGKKLVFVFDDVERKKISTIELFGFLNEYIEQLHVPCILIADKNKWNELGEKQSGSKDLLSMEEKVIGKEFHIQTSCEDVLKAWLAPRKGMLDVDSKVKNLWWNNREYVYELLSSFDSAKQKYLEEMDDFSFNNSEQQKFDREQMRGYVLKMPDRNYRALRQTIKDFHHLCIYFCPQLGNLIFSEKSKERGFDKHFIRYFLAMRYGCWLGLFDPNQIEVSRNFMVGLKFGERQYPAEKNSLTAWDCFSDICYNMDKIEHFPMQQWLTESFFDKEKVVAEINSSAWFGGRDAYLIRKIYHWWDLGDEEAKEAYFAVKDALKNGTLKSSAQLMILFVVLYSISDDGGANNKQFVVQQMNKYLDEHSNSVEFDEILSIEDIKQNYSPSDDCVEKIVDFRKRMLKIYNERENPYQEEKELFYKNLISSNPYEFDSACGIIQNISYKVTKFQWCMVDVGKFVDGYIKIERYKKGEILKIMRHRYLNVPDGYDLEKEKAFLSDLKNECLNRVNQKNEVPLPSNFLLKQMIERIEYLEKILENREEDK